MVYCGTPPVGDYFDHAKDAVFVRGQPLSFTLSFGEIPWFDEEGEIRRCDWSENAFLCMCLV